MFRAEEAGPRIAAQGAGANAVGEATNANVHPATRYPLALHAPIPLAHAAVTVPAEAGRLRQPFEAMRCAVPFPATPQKLVAGGGDFTTTLVAGRKYKTQSVITGSFSALRWTTVRWTAAASRPIERQSVAGSSFSWMAQVLAAVADLASEAAGVYAVGAPCAAAHWLASPDEAAAQPLVVQTFTETDWDKLVFRGGLGQLVVRLSELTDAKGVLLGVIATQAPSTSRKVPLLRRMAWSGCRKLTFLLQDWMGDAAELAAFSAGGYRALLPDEGALDWRMLQSTLAYYSARFGLGTDLEAALAAVQYFGAVPAHHEDLPYTGRPLKLPVVDTRSVFLAAAKNPASVFGVDVPLPSTATEWVGGITLGAASLASAQLGLARDFGADPTGLADNGAAIADIHAAAAFAGGDEVLAARLLINGYGLCAPFGRHFGPTDWADSLLLDEGRAASDPQLEAVVQALFGSGPKVDLAENDADTASHPPEVDMMDGRYGVLVEPGSKAHLCMSLPGMWRSIGYPPPHPAWYYSYKAALSRTADLQRGWQSLSARLTAMLDTSTAREDPPPSISMKYGVWTPPAKSYYALGGKGRLGVFYACSSAAVAHDVMMTMLTVQSVWRSSLAATAIGRTDPAVCPTAVEVPRPCGGRYMREARMRARGRGTRG